MKGALVLALLLVCDPIVDGFGGSGAPLPAVAENESEFCTEDLADRRGTSSSGCECISGGVEGAWGPHWVRPIRGADGGADYLHGNERWCPRR